MAYRITWKSRRTNASGAGRHVFTREQAEELASESNQEWPEPHHWIQEEPPAPADPAHA